MKLSIGKDIDLTDFDEDGIEALEYLPEYQDCPISDRHLLEKVFG